MRAVKKRITFVPIKYALTTSSTISGRIILRHFRTLISGLRGEQLDQYVMP